MQFFLLIFAALLTQSCLSFGAVPLPAPAARGVDFVKDIQPLFEAACVKCHAKGKEKGGFSLETRERFLQGGETGPGAEVGKSAESLVVELVSSTDKDEVMPKKGAAWTPEQVGLLRAWIDQGVVWPAGITFAKPLPNNLHPNAVALPADGDAHPLDRVLAPYFAAHGIAPPEPVADRIFARRVYLDLIGLLPTPEQLDAFLADTAPEKRATLVRTLLADRRNYADHWLAFWNDLLRNDYIGSGFIDGGRKQITGWLHTALVKNLPYDQFVAQLISPTRESEGFTRGIIWRGTVNASMLPPMQAAQNVAQVFLGVNLKCASCHDSFVNDWTLADAYGLAAIYAEDPLELIHCDKPTGKTAAMRFLYPEIGAVDPQATKPERLQKLAQLVTSRADGRLPRTLVNRLWARLLGRGLVEPLDDMDQPAWNRDALDWLAEDFVAHGSDVQHALEVICTSRAYQMPTVEGPREKEEFVFRGPLTRRLTAEQFADAISSLSGEWSRLPSSLEFDFIASGVVDGVQMPQWIWTKEPVSLAARRDGFREARSRLAEAEKKAVEARTAMSAALARGEPAFEAARLATEQVARAANAAQEQFKAAAATTAEKRHKVVFRKSFTLTELPKKAYGTVLGSQRFEVRVNTREAKSIARDGTRNGRIALFNFKPLLVAGENVVTIELSSHTEKQMNDNERIKFPASGQHLNKESGVAFYARLFSAGEKAPVEIRSDESWRVQRQPEGLWDAVAFADADWALATALPAGVAPVDEGPSLEPVTRKDFANISVELGPQLSPAVSTAANAGKIRAALLAADPLQVALDRPNREVVVPLRASLATTMQALELTNGATLDGHLQRAAAKLALKADKAGWLDDLYRQAISREPSASERALAAELLGPKPDAPAVADFLWALVNLPEFQMID